MAASSANVVREANQSDSDTVRHARHVVREHCRDAFDDIVHDACDRFCPLRENGTDDSRFAVPPDDIHLASA